jgi:hypothetical protein
METALRLILMIRKYAGGNTELEIKCHAKLVFYSDLIG